MGDRDKAACGGATCETTGIGRRELMRGAAGGAGALFLASTGMLPFAFAQQSGKAMNIVIQPEPPILILGLNQQGPTQTVAGKIYQGLLAYDFDLKPLPSLAQSWENSPRTASPTPSSCTTR